MAGQSARPCAVVIPNLNGETYIAERLRSLEKQSITTPVIVVDDGSTDHSVSLIQAQFAKLILIDTAYNIGTADAVNTGIRLALEQGYEAVALLNNDATAERDWLKSLVAFLRDHPSAGIGSSKILSQDGSHFDSTGQCYSTWGL